MTYRGLTSVCKKCKNALLRADYTQKSFRPLRRKGIFKFLNWLPSQKGFPTEIGPTIYKSEGLARYLGLERLYISFNGYAPERDAKNMTASFKDFEAFPTLMYIRENGIKSLILASAGNTARAFAYAVTSLKDIILHIVIPKSLLHKLWIPTKPTENIKVTIVEGKEDYYKAIQLAELISREFAIHPEGGARNVARRDGMGTVVLEYARVTREIPDHYFQSVGSGTGGVAVWEASLRLIGDGGVGDKLPKLHLSQNAPFTPLHNAWMYNIHIYPDKNVAHQLRNIKIIKAKVLANRNPPYNIIGGVRDALEQTGGITYAVTNKGIDAAKTIFKRYEAMDITPPAAVCLDSLIQAIRKGYVRSKDSILLNITGGGEPALRRDYKAYHLKPTFRIKPEDINPKKIARMGGYYGDS